MKKQLIALTVGLALTQPAFANNSQEVDTKPELVGVGSGMVLGGLVGGPVGIFIGALTGGMIGKSIAHEEFIETQNETITQLNRDNEQLMETAQRYNASELKIAKLNAELNQMKALSLAMNIQFRSGSSKIEPHFQQQLMELAELMHQIPELKLNLAGYSDPTGAQEFNMALSHKRADSVKAFLLAQGISEGRLHSQGYGANLPLVDNPNYESNNFERRVAISTVISNTATANLR
ncbi:sortase-associated OmpA-like protein PdsO [Paraferrimonas haliotis]|uniref:OmpA-like domain-containing protein n=1 Tax=Paraferrimonas haliotis TaxID=2013866 RepID=A0AA37TPB5_9GAMM|nr:sortase-associated OmpA-like protein PdsO [Paraferrimonas haliotis]GLS84403.1 hypothetical protein GCM10007894_23800 [Paraferrimonas haliotis]